MPHSSALEIAVFGIEKEVPRIGLYFGLDVVRRDRPVEKDAERGVPLVTIQDDLHNSELCDCRPRACIVMFKALSYDYEWDGVLVGWTEGKGQPA